MKIYRAFKQSCKKAGIENFRFHDLRHCFASQLVQNKVDLFRVQQLLGHKDSRMTQRYAYLTSENLQSAVKVFDNVGYNLATIEEFEKSKNTRNP
ncbi:site-specific integrase [Candidatus Poribacteria bacterium]|nr:site-specific integrase [Candidatus Poribacteria bacterium]